MTGWPALTPTATGATWNAGGEFIRAAYTLRKDDDFGQAGTLVRKVIDKAQRDRLVSNVAGHLNSKIRSRDRCSGAKVKLLLDSHS